MRFHVKLPLSLRNDEWSSWHEFWLCVIYALSFIRMRFVVVYCKYNLRFSERFQHLANLNLTLLSRRDRVAEAVEREASQCGRQTHIKNSRIPNCSSFEARNCVNKWFVSSLSVENCTRIDVFCFFPLSANSYSTFFPPPNHPPTQFWPPVGNIQILHILCILWFRPMNFIWIVPRTTNGSTPNYIWKTYE